jgi:hypothetical protein
MDCEPPYTRPAWPVLSKVEGYGGVRGALRQLMAEPSTRLAAGFITILLNHLLQSALQLQFF